DPVLPIYGEVARSAGGATRSSPPHSWGGGPQGRRGYLVDLCGEDEVVVREPAGGVSGQVDPQRTVGQVEVGVVALLLRQLGDLVDQPDPSHEALEAVGLGQLGLSIYVCDLPAGELTQQFLCARGRQGWCVGGADNAVSLR